MMTGDLNQILVVAKNEIIKCIRGKKSLISLVIMVLVFFLITGLQFATGDWDSIDSIGKIMSTYFSTLPLIIVLVVSLLSSVALVGEFEERTALILFTRPVRRTSILIGKMLSCIAVEGFIILVYYVLASVVSMIKVGEMPVEILVSFGLAILYAFAASGIAFVISSFLKKGSVCTIISVLLLLAIFPIVSSVMGTDGGENWFMIDQAGNTIYTSVPEYVDMYNETIIAFGNVVDSARAILEGFTSDDLDAAKDWLLSFISSPEFAKLDPTTQQSVMQMAGYMNMDADMNITGMIMVLKLMSSSSILSPMEYPDVAKEALVLLVWGIVGYFIAWIKFIRREF
jgi:ABC-2 type transport system permease protein